MNPAVAVMAAVAVLLVMSGGLPTAELWLGDGAWEFVPGEPDRLVASGYPVQSGAPEPGDPIRVYTGPQYRDTITDSSLVASITDGRGNRYEYSPAVSPGDTEIYIYAEGTGEKAVEWSGYCSLGSSPCVMTDLQSYYDSPYWSVSETGVGGDPDRMRAAKYDILGENHGYYPETLAFTLTTSTQVQDDTQAGDGDAGAEPEPAQPEPVPRTLADAILDAILKLINDFILSIKEALNL